MDLIAANLPYIAHDELMTLPVARHEPHLALDGGADGLDLIRRLLEQAPRVLAANGLLLMEIGAGQGARVCALAAAAFPGARVNLIHDYAGHDRVVRVEQSLDKPVAGRPHPLNPPLSRAREGEVAADVLSPWLGRGEGRVRGVWRELSVRK